MTRNTPLHPIGCGCRACAPLAHANRTNLFFKAAVRVLLLIAALLAIPFIIARFWASQGESR